MGTKKVRDDFNHDTSMDYVRSPKQFPLLEARPNVRKQILCGLVLLLGLALTGTRGMNVDERIFTRLTRDESNWSRRYKFRCEACQIYLYSPTRQLIHFKLRLHQTQRAHKIKVKEMQQLKTPPLSMTAVTPRPATNDLTIRQISPQHQRAPSPLSAGNSPPSSPSQISEGNASMSLSLRKQLYLRRKRLYEKLWSGSEGNNSPSSGSEGNASTSSGSEINGFVTQRFRIGFGYRVIRLENPEGAKVAVTYTRNGQSMDGLEVAECLATSESFRKKFAESLRDAGFRWEETWKINTQVGNMGYQLKCSPIGAKYGGNNFYCMLSKPIDFSDKTSHMKFDVKNSTPENPDDRYDNNISKGQYTFVSPTRARTRLVAPVPPLKDLKDGLFQGFDFQSREYRACHHIHSFMRGGSAQNIDTFLQTVGEQLQDKLADHKTVYLNTHGLRVPWLHARLDENFGKYNPPCKKCTNGKSLFWQKVHKQGTCIVKIVPEEVYKNPQAFYKKNLRA